MTIDNLYECSISLVAILGLMTGLIQWWRRR